MSQNRPPDSEPRGTQLSESWRVERMVQPVPDHLGEESRWSPWLVVAAVGGLVLVGALMLFFWQFPGAGGAAPSSATDTPRSRTTVVRLTATPGATSTPTAAPTVAMIKYTVKKGDTLSTIAQKFKVSVDALKKANNLADDTIHVGDVLIIPQPGPTPQALSGTEEVAAAAPTNTPLVFRTPTLIGFLQQSPTPVTPTTPTPTPGVVSYTVKSGDTLIGIAAVFSTTVQSIMDLNKLDGPSIRAGQALTVPVGAWTPTATPTVYMPPTATQTPEFTYSAPDLVFPSDGADFAHGASVTLQWLSPGALQSGEYYVVHLSYLLNGVEQNLAGYAIGEGTFLTLDTMPVNAPGPIQFWWYVVVVRDGGCGSANPAAVQPCALSPVSEKRSFTWR